MVRRTTRVPVEEVISTVEEANARVLRIAANQTAMASLQATADLQIAEIKTKLVADAQPHQLEIDSDVKALAVWAESRREELTKDGPPKTVRLPAGELRWRISPPKVNISNTQKVLAQLVGPFKRFKRVTVVVTVDKELMAKEREVAQTIDGVSITQREDFVVAPTSTNIEAQALSRKL